ncbi:YihY/virulence factor BrkB family protein [uncultured Jannaschia sp.]|uniref:YihY/virulence factor BrkB family protein n=1 Tax=uncultured Jannaschia sp. TaxID=293347 RepID=UPI002607D834|nr:YihY/virulence factor BrkB family protein [uncultured Jannaschia sp.]
MRTPSRPRGLKALATLAVAGGLAAVRQRRHNRDRDDTGDADPRSPHASEAPSELPTRGWIDVLKRTYAEITNDHVMLVAAGVTFYALLALFPALAALVSIYGLFADPATIQGHITALEGVLPGGTMEIISGQLESLASQGSAGLGLAFVLGLGTSLWSANAGVKSIFEALNIAYEEEETRGFIRLTLTSLAFTLGGLVFVILALGAVLAVPAILQNMAFGAQLEALVNWLRWPVLLIVVAGLIALLYRYGPSREPPEWRWVSWGSGIAAVLWLVFSGLFSWYASNFGSYDATYGSLGAAIGFMTWIWISTIVVVTGAELNSELEHETTADTTTGPERPMGARGAVMADRAAGGSKRAKRRGDGL